MRTREERPPAASGLPSSSDAFFLSHPFVGEKAGGGGGGRQKLSPFDETKLAFFPRRPRLCR